MNTYGDGIKDVKESLSHEDLNVLDEDDTLVLNT